MAETSNVLTAMFIVGLFLTALIFLEIDRLQRAGQATQETQNYSEEKRLEQSLDSLLKMTEPQTKETIGELIADYAYYGPVDVNYEGKTIQYGPIIEALFDGFYGKENYYSKILEIENAEGEIIPIEIGTKKEKEDQYCFERNIMRPDRKPHRFTFCIYKNRAPHEIIINKDKSPPVAIITATPNTCSQTPFMISFSGLASYDPDGGAIMAYKWEIDGKDAGTQVQFNYTFSGNGKHTIKLTVTDDESQTGSAEKEMVCQDNPVNCGDNICSGTETCTTCQQDCGPCPGCGNNTCDNGETCSSCPQDCGDCSGSWTFVLVPVNWSGTSASFTQTATQHYDSFINGAGLQSCQGKFAKIILDPADSNCLAPELKTCMCTEWLGVLTKIRNCAQKAGYTYNESKMRILGITTDNICTYKVENGQCTVPQPNVAGYTTGWGAYPVISETIDTTISAHETGHTFKLCDQYYNYVWTDQNAQLASKGGCKNYYPDGSTHCTEYGPLTTKCSDNTTLCAAGDCQGSMCKGRKIPVGSQTGRSSMSFAGQTAPRLFDCFETTAIKSAVGCG
ncbi:MAG: PKD domain-containing protein [Candidatus Diapherotrites archaeon]|nr:PKD domain-containing protein [Candidatus Diapherotrites archaeon]